VEVTVNSTVFWNVIFHSENYPFPFCPLSLRFLHSPLLYSFYFTSSFLPSHNNPEDHSLETYLCAKFLYLDIYSIIMFAILNYKITFHTFTNTFIIFYDAKFQMPCFYASFVTTIKAKQIYNSSVYVHVYQVRP
jgi:hypothetical protein